MHRRHLSWQYDDEKQEFLTPSGQLVSLHEIACSTTAPNAALTSRLLDRLAHARRGPDASARHDARFTPQTAKPARISAMGLRRPNRQHR